MEGYIKIESVMRHGSEGLSIQTDLNNVSPMDRLHIICGVCKALEIEPEELAVMAGFMASDLMDKTFKVETIEQEIQRVQFLDAIVSLWDSTLGKETDNEG